MQELSIVKTEFPLLVQSRGIDAPIAIKEATGKTENEILTAVLEVSENPRRGLSHDEIKKALKKLGVKHRDVSKLAELDSAGETKLHKHLTENDFLNKEAGEGKTYIVTNRNHVWTIKNKKTIDPVWVVPNKQATRRRITSVIEIVEPKH
ncbi:hypothetical protein PP935_gp197 [Rhizobium phage RHph_N34]|uniref:Uncharacterized protein n=2 Tax=Trinifflemingvirus TaxID=3044848 RepID=A0A7S5R9W6_9CAUD|nr:hypothetical protein PP935_gp197 [Rhizobium phage RHph_N34]YP_010661834.1 hypothetical protein PP936_gp196 [Rhizobium phage RHph_I1_9]QIG69767.1 hypothetical protein EVB81_198 [Rhizobium phage RHph_I46]QIG71048.1 hypothetical protein EVB92_198 [Rhizobium phage RHph_I9]QIG76387.1 hypothetical protein EVC25_198 [Rhizobium phage RHph_I34]QIG73633.1 hypothetical protein EVC04_196 [Rhizobium phage RHph_I1_9]QIG73972.1 hypothetical protein EVC06_197 [Rhizobium phage RHph_N34]